MLELLDSFFQIGFTMLSLELFSHGEGDRRLVQSLVSSDGHFDLITDSQEEETSLWLGKGYLSDDFIEAL